MENQYSPYDNVFGIKLSGFLSKLGPRIVFLVIFLGWTGYASWVALGVPFKTYVEEFVPEKHPS